MILYTILLHYTIYYDIMMLYYVIGAIRMQRDIRVIRFIRELRIMVYICVCVYMYINMSIYLSIYLSISLSLYIYIYIHIYILCMCIYVYIYIYRERGLLADWLHEVPDMGSGPRKTQQYAQKRVRPHVPNMVSYSGVGIALCESTVVREYPRF